jgi:hypothetical protein
MGLNSFNRKDWQLASSHLNAFTAREVSDGKILAVFKAAVPSSNRSNAWMHRRKIPGPMDGIALRPAGLGGFVSPPLAV